MANLQITLYDPETNEVRATYTRTFIPWKLLKRAIRLMKKFGADFDAGEMTEDDIDELAALVVDTFSGQFTVDELGDGADVSEMLTVLTAIMVSAGGTFPNPPPRGG